MFTKRKKANVTPDDVKDKSPAELERISVEIDGGPAMPRDPEKEKERRSKQEKKERDSSQLSEEKEDITFEDKVNE